MYYLLDHVWNGLFVDWFMQSYMITHEVYSDEVGKMTVITEPLWGPLKELLLAVFIAAVLVCLFVASATARIYGKMRVKAAVTEISRMLHGAMAEERELEDIFPQEYAEISVQVSEIRSAMQRHEQMQKEASARKNDLIAYLAHDLRTPLTSVVGYLSLLDEAADMPEEQRRKYIRIAFQKARRLEELNNEFFEITRYNLQRMDLEKKSIDLYYMLCQMAEEFYPLLQEHGSRIVLHVGEELMIRGDGDKLARAFGNILKNAIAYSYPDTDIEIRSEPVEGGLCLHFSNRGPTIPPQKLETIFDKFVRLDASRSSHTGGAGLGLAIAREIITLHGGEITANSEDEMTVFYVILPVD
ncbi:MAG TPA: sensor histidine kinase [Lachnospiraceae bacterium]|nr:sensor histidine kinase [Lachnospiraceae bacterium]